MNETMLQALRKRIEAGDFKKPKPNRPDKEELRHELLNYLKQTHDSTDVWMTVLYSKQAEFQQRITDYSATISGWLNAPTYSDLVFNWENFEEACGWAAKQDYHHKYKGNSGLYAEIMRRMLRKLVELRVLPSQIITVLEAGC